MTHAVNASRALSLGTSVGAGVIAAIATGLGLALVGGLLAIRGFRRPL